MIDTRSGTTNQVSATASACRGCGTSLTTKFVDLGSAPPSNAYRTLADLSHGEMYFPLRAYVCDVCYLVQLEAFQTPTELFSNYAYFSSFSSSWLEHGAEFASAICEREALVSSDLVLEIASNDGYLLHQFAQRGIRVIGVEPAQNVARAAVQAGIPTIVSFFSEACARVLRAENYTPRLIIANNVLAHVPNLHDFVAGLAVMLDVNAVATIEVPHLLRLIESCQFDTIYHEHFSYFSLLALEPIFRVHGLAVVDAEQLRTHGGSLRLYIRPEGHASPNARVEAVRKLERDMKLDDIRTYMTFADNVIRIKRHVLSFLLDAQSRGETVAAYGAPAKGNTFLNYCGIRRDLVDFAVDRSPHKQGSFLPGSRIPILAPDELRERRPAYVIIMPWNLTDEVKRQIGYIREWGGRFVTTIPDLEIHP